MNVSIIIPNYNGQDLLLSNLPQILLAAENQKNKVIEVIVIDDKSTDNSLEVLNSFKKQIKVIKHTKNRGFSAAVNSGARAAKGDLLCLINTDVVPKSDFLEPVIPHFKDGSVFAVSLHEKGYGPSIGKFENGFITHHPASEKKKTTNTFWVSGGSGVFKRETWMKLGGMNEDLYSPFYWEDVDLSYIALKRGYRLLWEPKSFVTHQHETTMKKHVQASYRQLIQERNYLIFQWKNITSSRLAKKHREGLVKRLKAHPGYIKIVFLALLKYSSVRKNLARENKESTVSDEAIFASFQ